MPLYCVYRYYLGSAVYEVEADSASQAYAALERAVHTANTDGGRVRLKHEAMLPALNEIASHIHPLQANGELSDHAELIMHQARDEKLTELINTPYDPEPELLQH